MPDRDFSPARRRLTALRLAAQGIVRGAADAAPDDPTEVVRGMLALQAQDFSGALWSIGLRTASATRRGVEAAHETGAFVRSWPMRGTLHFVVAEDLPWMLSLTGERMVRSAEGRRRQLELDHAQFDRAERIARERMADGATISRPELFAAWEQEGLPTTGQRGVHLLAQLAQKAVIVLVGQHEWALLEHRVPHPRLPDRPSALREFALRYFLSHGPATDRDFAWWSSLTLADARAGIAAAREQLDVLDLAGTAYYLRPGLQPAGRAVRLLPGFDEYLLGYSDRSAPLSGADSSVIVPGGNGMFLSTMVLNGEVIGSWRRTPRAKKVDLDMLPFRDIPESAHGGIAAAARRYGAYLEQPVELRRPSPH
ncbi:MAG: winged helix DNA-binding domain-containing protein [Pseudolysinimonas sp.]